MDQPTEKQFSHLHPVDQVPTNEVLDWIKIGERIRKQRLFIDLTQEDLAEKLGVKKQTISNYENGNCKMNNSEALKTIYKLAKNLHCSIEYLLMEVDYPNQLLLTKAGERIYSESLNNLFDEDQEKIRIEYNSRKETGEFNNPNSTKTLITDKDYELIPISTDLTTTPINQTYKQAAVAIYKGALYFYNIENNTALCLKSSDEQGTPVLYRIKNTEFSYNFPPFIEQLSPSPLTTKQEAYDRMALFDLIMFVQENPMMFTCLEKFINILLFSVKNNDEYTTIASFLSNYKKHTSLLKTFFKTLEIQSKSNLQHIEETLLKLNNDATAENP